MTRHRSDVDAHDLAEAARLLRAARRTEPSATVQERVQARLDTTPERRRLRPRLAWAAAILLFSSLTAGASRWIARRVTAPRAPRQVVIPAAPPSSCVPRSPSHEPPAAPPPPVIPPAPPSPAPTLLAPLVPAASANVHRHTAPALVEPMPASSAPENKLVYEAARALRARGDAGEARSLVEDYLRAHPDGQLAEEAWAIEMQAAAERGDADAGEIARRYRARFPTGRYLEEARRASTVKGPPGRDP